MLSYVLLKIIIFDINTQHYEMRDKWRLQKTIEHRMYSVHAIP